MDKSQYYRQVAKNLKKKLYTQVVKRLKMSKLCTSG